jgi:hypothetical protein
VTLRLGCTSLGILAAAFGFFVSAAIVFSRLLGLRLDKRSHTSCKLFESSEHVLLGVKRALLELLKLSMTSFIEFSGFLKLFRIHDVALLDYFKQLVTRTLPLGLDLVVRVFFVRILGTRSSAWVLVTRCLSIH